MLMRENVNNEVRKDSSILRFVILQEACGPDNAQLLHFLFLGYAHVIDQKKNTCYVSSIIYSLGLNHKITSLSHVLYYSSTFKSKQYMQDD